MSFLKAEWRKLIMANYEVEPSVLQPYLPPHTELDTWQGRHYLSVVGFLFQNTRLFGWLKVPWHINFEEVNLRFYVRHKTEDGWKRGVVFIQEIVPRFALSFVANTIYKEHYKTRKMRHSWQQVGDRLNISYAWQEAKKQWQSISVSAAIEGKALVTGSEAEFITEHYWGYSKVGVGKSNEYEVKHPSWLIHQVLHYDIDIDYALAYGQDFAFLNKEEPLSVFLAEGSEISVENKRLLY